MKICYIASANSVHSFRWIKYFAEKSHEIHWISLQKNDFEIPKNTNFYLLKQFPHKFLDIIFTLREVRSLLEKIKPHILHAHYAGVNGALGALSGFHPFVLTTWGSDILIRGNSILTRPLIKFILKKADLITCDAKHIKKALMDFGISEEKIKIIYFGVEVDKFTPGPKDETIIKKLELQHSPVIISLRNLEPLYNVETLIKAIPLVLQEAPQTKFIIAGEGSEKEKLKNLAKELKVLKNIRFVGFIPNNELPKYLRSADIYVSTSLSDAGISASTAEAMACGLPVVITNTGENEKWVKDGEGGYLIPIKSPKVLAERIIHLVKNKNLREKFGKINRKIIEEKNNYLKEMGKMEKIYEEIINKNKKRPS